MGGMNPKHAIVTGLGAAVSNSVGYPWNARYTIASGNLLADFRANLNAESQGRLQVVRLYEISDDSGYKTHYPLRGVQRYFKERSSRNVFDAGSQGQKTG
jgi:Mn-containing catalase